jgi:hypothetical protein
MKDEANELKVQRRLASSRDADLLRGGECQSSSLTKEPATSREAG